MPAVAVPAAVLTPTRTTTVHVHPSFTTRSSHRSTSASLLPTATLNVLAAGDKALHGASKNVLIIIGVLSFICLVALSVVIGSTLKSFSTLLLKPFNSGTGRSGSSTAKEKRKQNRKSKIPIDVSEAKQDKQGWTLSLSAQKVVKALSPKKQTETQIPPEGMYGPDSHIPESISWAHPHMMMFRGTDDHAVPMPVISLQDQSLGRQILESDRSPTLVGDSPPLGMIKDDGSTTINADPDDVHFKNSAEASSTSEYSSCHSYYSDHVGHGVASISRGQDEFQDVDITDAIQTYFFTTSPSTFSTGTLGTIPEVTNSASTTTPRRVALWNATQVQASVPIRNFYEVQDSTTASLDGVAYNFPSVDSVRVQKFVTVERKAFGDLSNIKQQDADKAIS